MRGKEDSDETEDDTTMVQDETFRVETLDDSQVEGQPECESVCVECQKGMTEDEVDGGMEEREVVIQDGEDAGEERNVLKADPGELKLWQ